MSKILIVGNSIAAAAAIEQIRKDDVAAEITLLCPEGLLPFNRFLLPSLVAKDLKEPHLLVHSDKFFQAQNVKVILNDPLLRLSVKRKHATTEGKVQIVFDKLLLVDPPAVKLPPVKGHQKEGAFDSLRATSVKAFMKYLPYADNIIVPVTNFSGFDMACALSRVGKEVVIVTSAEGLLPEYLDEESGILLKQIVESKGMRVMSQTTIEEILGDQSIKAVRLGTGKVIAAEAVVFDSLQPDLRMLSESDILEDGNIKAGEFFETPAEGVFVCDAALSGYGLSTEESSEQGRAAALNMFNVGSCVYQAPLVTRTFGPKICDAFCVGTIGLIDGGRELMKFDGPSNIYKKIFLYNDHLSGAVWFNSIAEKDRVGQAISQQLSLAGAEDQFLGSNTLLGQ